jgi:molybdopterin synthase sulfur carrier subunit
MISVTVLYFASFRERLGLEKETIEISGTIKNIADLKQLLVNRQDVWEDIFGIESNVLISINQNMAKNHSVISDLDEIAFSPPSLVDK